MAGWPATASQPPALDIPDRLDHHSAIHAEAKNQFFLNRAAPGKPGHAKSKFPSPVSRAEKRFLIGSIIALLSLLGFMSGLAAGSPENPDADFRFHGKPIHALLIKQFEPWVSDARPPITVEVNLSAAWDSNEYAAECKTDSNGVVSVSLPEGASYAYQHLGKLRDGLHVLRTFDSEGGSGVFEAILFVRFRSGPAYLADGVKQGEQIFLQVVRRYPLGDRDGAEVLVKPDRVVIGQSRYRENPVVLNFGKDNSLPGNQKPK